MPENCVNDGRRYPQLEAVEYDLPQDLPSLLKEGSVLWKVRSYSRWYRRKYFLSLESMRVIYDGSHKVPCLSEPVFHIDISEIDDVRKGWKTDTFNKLGNKVAKGTLRHPDKRPLVDERTCFSIVFGPQHKTLDLVAPNEEVCDSWVCGLQQIIAMEKSVAYKRGYELWMRKQFKLADKDKTGTLNFPECLDLLKLMNICVSLKHAKKLFKEANVNHNVRGEEEVLDEYEFVEFYRSLLHRPELSDLIRRFGVHYTEMMGLHELQSFIINEQKMPNVTLDQCKALINAYESQNVDNGHGSKELTLGGFRLFLLSDNQSIFNTDHEYIYQDMTRPLCDYYIASSHNTYLLDDQLAGRSSVEGYINALKQGCRCVEMDLWDGDDGEPIIYHGYTLTSKILFKEVLSDAIKPHAFAVSEYPLILSFENHCSNEQQKVIARHLITVLGDMLYTSSEVNTFTELPSPEYLKGKIIIKAKRLPDIEDEDTFGSAGHSDSETEEESDLGPSSSDRMNHHPKVASGHVAEELSDLVVICRSAKFQSFEHSRLKGHWYDIVSLSEKTVHRMISESARELVEHNQRQLVRIYPSGGRADSSNYKPIPMWNSGCQIVALNYQTADKATLFNAAKFKGNGNCGYVLKPQILREGNFDPNVPVDLESKKLITIKVVSGQHIPKPEQSTEGEVVDPYVIIKVRGHMEDKMKVQTQEIHNNGFNPVWNETFTFPIKVPELAFLHFIVRDYSSIGKDEILGQYVIPFTSVQQGYRHVHLLDKGGNPIVPASIFVHINIADSNSNGGEML